MVSCNEPEQLGTFPLIDFISCFHGNLPSLYNRKFYLHCTHRIRFYFRGSTLYVLCKYWLLSAKGLRVQKKSTDKGAGKNRNTISNINCNMGKFTLQSQKCAKLGHRYVMIKRIEIQPEKKNIKLDKKNCDY